MPYCSTGQRCLELRVSDLVRKAEPLRLLVFAHRDSLGGVATAEHAWSMVGMPNKAVHDLGRRPAMAYQDVVQGRAHLQSVIEALN